MSISKFNTPLDLEYIKVKLLKLVGWIPLQIEEPNLSLEYRVPFNKEKNEIVFTFTTFIYNNSFSLFLYSKNVMLFSFYFENMLKLDFLRDEYGLHLHMQFFRNDLWGHVKVYIEPIGKCICDLTRDETNYE